MAFKELIVVMVLAWLAFALATPVGAPFLQTDSFERRKKVWLGLTAAAFLLPSFWLYVALAVPLLIWLRRTDTNPQSLLVLFYLLVPPFAFKVPMPGAHYAFELTQLRLLGLVVILPWLSSWLRANPDARRWTLAETLMACYIVIQIVFLIPHEDVTNTFRRTFVTLLDSMAVLYFMSRIRPTRSHLVDVVATLCMVSVAWGLLAMFENVRSWSLYGNLYSRWGALGDLWNLRDGRLRALVSAGHALTLGYLLAMAFCFWLWFRPLVKSRVKWLGIALVILGGLLATNSRGPWLTALMAFVLVSFLTAKSAKEVVTRAAMLTIAFAGVLVSPIGDEVISKIPFIGEDEWGNVAYRVRLAEVSWQVVWLNPFFGDPFVTRNLEELRQAQGIIDLVNAYATVALFHGFVGLGLYAGIFTYALFRAYRAVRYHRHGDEDMHRLGICLIAALVSTLFFMATAGFAIFQYVLAGLLISYGNSAPARVPRNLQPQRA